MGKKADERTDEHRRAIAHLSNLEGSLKNLDGKRTRLEESLAEVKRLQQVTRKRVTAAKQVVAKYE